MNPTDTRWKTASSSKKLIQDILRDIEYKGMPVPLNEDDDIQDLCDALFSEGRKAESDKLWAKAVSLAEDQKEFRKMLRDLL